MTRSSGWRRNSSRVATPKLPPPPRSPQSSSGFSSSLARTTSPAGVTSSAATRLSQVSPYCAVRWPIPPPRVRPVTPVEPTTPPGVTRPCAWVAASKSSQVAPPSEVGDARLGIDLDVPHPREVDHEAVVDRAVSGRVVASAADRDLQAVRLGEGEGRSPRRRRRRSGRSPPAAGRSAG